MSDHIPPEVVNDILSRLPTKSLLRFRCVCKKWRSLISSANFITDHFNRSTTNKHAQKLVLTRYLSSPSSRNEFYRLRFDNDSFAGYAKFKCPFESLCYFRFVGICNGLVCLSDDIFGNTYTLVIWNPSIHRYLILPKPSFNLGFINARYMFVLGFGFDVKKNDYKVVRLAYLLKKLTPSGEIYHATPKVEIFSVSTCSWRTMKRGALPVSIVFGLWSQVFLNGSVHWAAYKKEEGREATLSVILSFDMTEEKFGVMGFPQLCATAYPGDITVGLHRESLALFWYDTRKDCTSFSVYVMKEYGVVESWTEMYRVADVEGGIRAMHGFREDGELLLSTKDEELVSYEPNSKRMKKLGIKGVKESVCAGSYAESLVLLDGLKGRLANQVKSYKNSLPRTKNYPEVDDLYIEHHVAMRYEHSARSTPWNADPSTVRDHENEPDLSFVDQLVKLGLL